MLDTHYNSRNKTINPNQIDETATNPSSQIQKKSCLYRLRLSPGILIGIYMFSSSEIPFFISNQISNISFDSSSRAARFGIFMLLFLIIYTLIILWYMIKRIKNKAVYEINQQMFQDNNRDGEILVDDSSHGYPSNFNLLLLLRKIITSICLIFLFDNRALQNYLVFGLFTGYIALLFFFKLLKKVRHHR